MHYVFLLIAIVAEVIGTSALKATDNFTRLWPTLLVAVSYGVAFYCMTHVIRVLPVGVTYAIWSGLGIVLVSVVAWRIYGQQLDAAAIIGMALIVAGVAVINLFSRIGGHA